jgi:predicted CoA-binding protein
VAERPEGSAGRQELDERIRAFLAAGPWAVAGATSDRSKYGNKVLRCYLQNAKTPVFPVNPRAQTVEGLRCYPSLAALPEPARAVSIITPPAVTEEIVREAAELGITHLWMQPGAESARALELAREAGIEPIAGGPCILVVLRYRE